MCRLHAQLTGACRFNDYRIMQYKANNLLQLFLVLICFIITVVSLIDRKKNKMNSLLQTRMSFSYTVKAMLSLIKCNILNDLVLGRGLRTEKNSSVEQTLFGFP